MPRNKLLTKPHFSDMLDQRFAGNQDRLSTAFWQEQVGALWRKAQGMEFPSLRFRRGTGGHSAYGMFRVPIHAGRFSYRGQPVSNQRTR